MAEIKEALDIIQYCRGTKKTISKEELDDNLFEVEKILYEYLKEDKIG